MPPAFTNNMVREGAVVIKTYLGPDPGGRRKREAAALRALREHLPVPPLLGSEDNRLTMGYVDGVHGQDLIEDGLAERLMRSCGYMLREVHSVGPEMVFGEGLVRPGQVLVHGDYGPNNLLLNPATMRVTAIVDWEWTHAGEPLEDLASCEWIVRMYHPRHVAAIEALFDGYGYRPSWTARHAMMIEKCRALVTFAEQWPSGGEGTQRRRKQLAATEGWIE